jgi:hypothetical protein
VVGEFLFLTACPPVLDRLLGDATPCRWSFPRLPDVRVGTSVRLSFHAATPVLDALAEQSEQALDELGWQTSTDRALFRADVPAERLGMVFSTRSSELALALLTQGTLPAAAKRAFAVTHLLRLVTPVPDARTAGLPLNYLRFDHARLTYNRVGISPDNEGFAARLLRSALVNGDISRREPAAA